MRGERRLGICDDATLQKTDKGRCHRAIGLLGYQAVGLSGCRAIGRLGLPGCRVIGLSGYRVIARRARFTCEQPWTQQPHTC